MKLKSVLGTLIAVGAMACMAVGVQAATYSAGSSEVTDGVATIPVVVTPDTGETTQVNGYIVKFTYDNTKATPVLKGTDETGGNLYAAEAGAFDTDNAVIVADIVSTTEGQETLAVAWAGASPVTVDAATTMANVDFTVADTVTESVPVTVEVVAVTNDGATIDANATGADGEITVASGTVYLYGDVDNNGKVEANDASLVVQYALGSITLDADAIIRANVDGNYTDDGSPKVDANDASLIIQKALGNLDLFPVEQG